MVETRSPVEVSVSGVPFLDLARMHRSLKDALLADLGDMIDRSAFVNGPQVGAFEEAFAHYCGTSFGVGVASGLDALRLGLLASGVTGGDEVIVPAQTFVATLEAVTQAGATPVIADIDPTDYCLNPAAAEAAVTGATRAIVPVHLFGQMADMAALSDLASRLRLKLVEDACQAHGAERGGFCAGAGGTAGAFSFYPGKNLGAMGDAGALVTDDPTLAEHARTLREHGQKRKYEHELEGFTARLDTAQAIVLLHKLPLLDGWNAARAQIAALYSELLDGIEGLRLPVPGPGSRPVWHLYVVRMSDPADLADHLAERGIGSGRHYPQPPHLTTVYGHLGHARGDFPVAEALADESLSLPIFPGMTEAETVAVAAAVRDYFLRSRGG